MRKRHLKGLLVSAVVVLLLWGASFSPRVGLWSFQTATAAIAWWYDFETRQVALGDITFSVYVRPGQDTAATPVVLLHGYTANKALWLPMAAQLDSSATIIIPDLAGHGETGFDPQWSYRASAQAQRLQRLFAALQIEQPVLVGHSMSGLIAANFALLYPQQLSALIVMNPTGVTSPTPSRAEKLLQQGRSPFLINNWQDFQELYQLSMAQPPWIPNFIQRGVAYDYRQHKAEFSQIAEDFLYHDQLDQRLSELQIPTLILWGAEDALIDVSSADVWHSAIQGSEMVVLEQVGHMPMLERPRQTADELQRFLKRH
ncbi:alpha/beta fold hydrolase [Pseudidiomarina sediminum]|uniref:alpha/beta fold hydrolase n=1 Tax=Pseudidiomarina sediminum TaxID=431675 RepID=UPI001C98C249|nr:alpha/beta hydrolase [Pseudidiomarina sediminum]